MKDKLIRKKIPASVVSTLFVAGAVLALLGIIITLILLPGMTFRNILSVTEFRELSNFFVAIAVIIVTLYFIMRYIHGITSRDLLERFTKNRAECLSRQVEITGSASGSTGNPGDIELSVLRRAAELLLETQIYQVDKKTLFGTFPVYIVNPDFTWVFASTVTGDNDIPGQG